MGSKYIYIGKGAAVVGIPARDLDEADLGEFHLDEKTILATGLYRKADEPKTTKKDKKAGE